MASDYNNPCSNLHRSHVRLEVLQDILYEAGMYESDDYGHFCSYDIAVYGIPLRKYYSPELMEIYNELHELQHYLDSIHSIDKDSIIMDLIFESLEPEDDGFCMD